MTGKRVLVAMSGGVDSSVAAALLKEEGYEVIGATIKFWSKELCGFDTPRSCCNLKSIEEARAVAQRLRIPYYVFNFEDEFRREVIDYFLHSYSKGRTPNPCIICNEKIKWGFFLQKARKIGADFIATGHYAKIGYQRRRKRFFLKEAAYKQKDQSYVLFSLSQIQLSRTLLPLGDYTKPQVRELARKYRFSIFDKAESQELCFIPQGDKNKFFLKSFPGLKTGQIANSKGDILGRHRGIVFYTIGQREGLGITARVPLYVIRIEAASNTIVVGNREEAKSSFLIVGDLNWVSIDKPKRKIRVQSKIRYKHLKAEAIVFPQENGSAKVIFDSPQFAPANGQAAVFYEGDILLGGGWIEETQN